MKPQPKAVKKEMPRVVRITGKTFDVRDKLRLMGGFWSADEKCWLVPEDQAAAARKLVRSVSGTPPENFIIVDEDDDLNGDDD